MCMHADPDPAAADAGGRKRALLIGCSYPGTPYELKGCCTDIDFMRHLLMKQFGYRPDSIMVLRDAPTRDNPAPVSEREIPTRERILLAMKDLVRDARHGDFLFFHFSGAARPAALRRPPAPMQRCRTPAPRRHRLVTDAPGGALSSGRRCVRVGISRSGCWPPGGS